MHVCDGWNMGSHCVVRSYRRLSIWIITYRIQLVYSVFCQKPKPNKHRNRIDSTQWPDIGFWCNHRALWSMTYVSFAVQHFFICIGVRRLFTGLRRSVGAAGHFSSFGSHSDRNKITFSQFSLYSTQIGDHWPIAQDRKTFRMQTNFVSLANARSLRAVG